MTKDGREKVAVREVAEGLDIRYAHALRLVKTARAAVRIGELRGRQLFEACEKLLKEAAEAENERLRDLES